MTSRSMTRGVRALVALSALGLLSLGSCDIAGDEGGPGPSPGISGGIPPGPLATPFALQNMRGNPGTADLESNSFSDRPSVSATGRYWAFSSFATNLVAGVSDGRRHVYVRDVVNQTTRLVSRASDSAGMVIANSDSQDAFISDNGRYVVFATFANNLDLNSADTNNLWDIYRRDRVGADNIMEGEPGDNGDATTVRVSLVHGSLVAAANGHSFRPSISDNGDRVAFQSDATNIAGAGDTNGGVTDIYVREVIGTACYRVSCQSGTTTAGNSTSFNPCISGNGNFVSFISYAGNLVPNDTFGYLDVFRSTVSHFPAVDRVSLGIQSQQPNDYCYANYFQGGGRNISQNGLRVAFASSASNLVAGDSNGWDVFVRDFGAGPLVMTRVLSTSGEQPNSFTFEPRLSADGTKMAFLSSSSNLGSDGDFNQDIFMKDFSPGGGTTLASVTFSGNSSDAPLLSSDGKVVGFTSSAPDIVLNDNNGQQDVFGHAFADGEFDAGTIFRVSVPTVAGEADQPTLSASISAGGPVVVFETAATNMVTGHSGTTRDIYVSDPIGQVVRLVSKNSAGQNGNNDSRNPVCSSDGRFVAFESLSTNLIDLNGDGSYDDTNDDTNGVVDIFVHDVVSGVTVRVSVKSDGSESDADCLNPSMSADGRFIAFESTSTQLHDDAASGFSQIFVHDRLTKTTSLVSRADGASGAEADSDCFNPFISSNGLVVAFVSAAANLDTNVSGLGTEQIFVRDGSTTACVSQSGGTASDSNCANPSLSADGRIVAYQSFATNLVTLSDLVNIYSQVFLRDRQGTGSTTCVSMINGVEGDNHSFSPSLSADGRYVAFHSSASNLHPAGNGGGFTQVLVRDRTANATALVSIDDLGAPGDSNSSGASISADGRWVAFLSDAQNLVPPDNGDHDDIFIRGPLDGTSFVLD